MCTACTTQRSPAGTRPPLQFFRKLGPRCRGRPASRFLEVGLGSGQRGTETKIIKKDLDDVGGEKERLLGPRFRSALRGGAESYTCERPAIIAGVRAASELPKKTNEHKR
jgi:hypothetical protein